MTDNINNPSHYTEGFSNGAEVIDITENLPFNRGNAIKYLARAGKKAGAPELDDLRKSEFYVKREIARVEAVKQAEESAALSDALRSFLAPLDPTAPFAFPIHTSEVSDEEVVIPRTFAEGDEEPTDVRYIRDGVGDLFRYEGPNEWTYQTDSTSDRWGTVGGFDWSEVLQDGPAAEDLEYSEASDLTVDEPVFAVGDRVRVSDSPETAAEGFVSHRAAGKMATVEREIDEQGDVKVRIDDSSLVQFISPKHLTKVGILAEWEKELLEAAEEKVLRHTLKVGDKVRVTGPWKTFGGYGAYPEYIGGADQVFTVSNLNDAPGVYDVDHDVQIQGRSGDTQWINAASLTVETKEPAPDLAAGDRVRVATNPSLASGEGYVVQSIGGHLATVIKNDRTVEGNVTVKSDHEGYVQFVGPQFLTKVYESITSVPKHVVVKDIDGDKWKVDEDGDIFISTYGDDVFGEWDEDEEEADKYGPFEVVS